MRYYWCVNCGLYHDLKEERQRGIECTNCGYKDVMEMDQGQWNDAGKERPWIFLDMDADTWFKKFVDPEKDLIRDEIQEDEFKNSTHK